jgi:hypothetical protein
MSDPASRPAPISPPPPSSDDPVEIAVKDALTRWIEGAVIGLRLCPFAASPWNAGEVRLRVSRATTPEDAVRDALDEALHLMEVSEDEVSTTLVAFPDTLADFETFLDAHETLDHILDQAGSSGILQVASFHPDFVFADADPADLGNFTNRAPVPILHLLRETQVSAAVDSHPDPEAIPGDNVERLEDLGRDQVLALWHAFAVRRAP